MASITEKTARVLNTYKNKKLAIGVSGGRDSMCLLHAVLHCGVIDASNILAVHVNHCLREQADSDERFVKSFCEKNGVKFEAYRVDVKKQCERSGASIEQAARDLRYGVFYDILKRGGADVILTAHHALDNAETILMHMFRGAGLDGLCGMNNPQVKAETGESTHTKILRPFIDVTPDELDEYCKANGIEYVVDQTNFIDDADRNFLRLNVIPLIEQRYSGAVRSINKLASECRQACAFMDSALDPKLINYEDGAVVIKTEALLSPLAARYVRRALLHFTRVDVTREQTDRVISLAHMRTGATVELTGYILAVREYDGVALYVPRLFCDTELPIKLGANTLDGLAVDIEYGDVPPRETKGGAVDFEKLDGAVLRFRRDGDVFKPFGGKTKKLKQYFIDNKIPKRMRDRIPLICKGNEVLVIVGVQISDDVKQTCDTTQKAVVRRRW
ncbi:MAG: tRNA lysidine(34) synthetase TilS [Clostridiales bacterium]|nr:tRNA lysidine(34) synthetase TilS [Clostridiales bacterium]